MRIRHLIFSFMHFCGPFWLHRSFDKVKLKLRELSRSFSHVLVDSAYHVREKREPYELETCGNLRKLFFVRFIVASTPVCP